MPFRAVIDLNQIAKASGGRIDGDGAFAVNALGSLEHAKGDALAFYADPKQRDKLKTTSAGAVMLRAEHAELFRGHKVIVDDPYLAYARISALFMPPSVTPSIHPSAIVAASASVHADVAVGAYSVIGENTRVESGVLIGSHVSVGDDCILGSDTTLDSGVHVYARTSVGARCHLSSGVVLGASGFGYAENDGAWMRIEQLGGVVLGDEVDVGANTTIDRGAIDNTVIGNGVKLDNHIQIAHNVTVGEHTIMAACVAVAGSTTIGKRCRLGGCVGVLGHLEIADDVTLNADTSVIKSITKAGTYSSIITAQPVAQWRKIVANLYRLEQLAQQVKTLTKRI